MIQINSVEISYFRSIYKIRLKDLSDVIVLAGRNDVGKSNILKALNLFFNNQADWNTSFDFDRDFSRRRLAEVRKDTIKGKQFIQVAVDFIRGSRSEKSLPDHFTVTKTWYRYSQKPDERNSLSNQFQKGSVPTQNLDRAQASLQRYLNTVRFEYVPAIKDHNFFTYMLGRLQDIIFGKTSDESKIADTVQQFNLTVEKDVTELREEFQRVSGVPINIHLPDQLGELFRAFAVATKSGQEDMSLNLRGDGIRSRFLPSLLHYVSQHSNLQYIWGFEEPENSLEHALATKLARQVVDEYSRTAQVLITSHSPAFFGLEDEKVTVYRICSDQQGTMAEPINELPSKSFSILEKELGLTALQKSHQRKYEAELADLDVQQKKLKTIREKMSETMSPVLLTEGKWDAVILNEAWEKIHKNSKCPFRILSCDTTPDDPAHGTGGVPTLKPCLETVRPDEPITVGLFDRDNAGFNDGFNKLNKNFECMPDEPNVKISKNYNASAIVLPVIPIREEYAKHYNLVLEFYFGDQYLEHKIDGKGLILEQAEILSKVPKLNVDLGMQKSSEPYLRRIQEDSKKNFAELIVPTLPEDAFTHFASLFKLVQKVISKLEKTKRSLQRKRRNRSKS